MKSRCVPKKYGARRFLRVRKSNCTCGVDISGKILYNKAMENNRANKIGERLTPSAKIMVALEASAACLAAAFLIVSAIVYAVSPDMGLKTFSALFFPLVICIAVALITGINQTCRGKNAIAIVFLITAGACLLSTVGMIIFECVTYGKFFLAPFTFVG